MTSIAAESKFVELVRGWLVSLPHDLKIAFDAMDDENLPREVREVATGVAIYVVSPNDFIQDRNDAVRRLRIDTFGAAALPQTLKHLALEGLDHMYRRALL